MDRPMPKYHFACMSFMFTLRDVFSSRRHVLQEVGIKPGFHVLDYGCGPGRYIIPLTELVGKSGKVYALDIHPIAIKRVKNIISKNKLINVETILSGNAADVVDESMDVILFYDTFHLLSDKKRVLQELHRLLKPTDILSFSDHHMKKDEILSELTSSGLFRLSGKGRKTYSFLKEA